MAKSQTTFSKKEKEKKRLQKRREKEEKKAQRKLDNNKGKSLEDMMAYVDEFGNILDSPPDPEDREEINVEDISVSGYQVQHAEVSNTRKGKLTYYNDEKGYGFITDRKSQDRVFMHINNCVEEIQLNDDVEYEIERSPKGESAINVRKL
ncbi:MAG: cold-shock protein [Bacteroidia bacterium]